MMVDNSKHAPALSIIVPVYGVEQYLRRCMDSVLAQSLTDFEVILVNDGSPDECPMICDEYANVDSRVRVVHKKNGGLSSARNVGLSLAMGKYLGFVDSDDYIDRHMYEQLLTTMKQHSCDMVFCDNYRVSGNSVSLQSWGDESRFFTRQGMMKKLLMDEIGSQAWNKLYRRDLFADIRYPEGRLFEDIATTYRYVHRCEKIGYIKQPLYYYLLRDTGISLSPGTSKYYHIFLGFKERYEFSRANYPEHAEGCLKLAVEHSLNIVNYSMQQGLDAFDNMAYKDTVGFLSKERSFAVKCNGLSIAKRVEIIVLLLNKSFCRKAYLTYFRLIQLLRR